MERVKCTQTLTLSHGDGEVIFEKPSIQMYLSQVKEESKGFAFWVEFVVQVTFPMWFVSYCIGTGVYPMRTQKVAIAGSPRSIYISTGQI